MKNLKVNTKKIKDLLKRGCALTTLVFTLSSLSGCSNNLPEDWPNEFIYINQENNRFDDYTSTVIKNGQPTTVYNGENIAVVINKETFEVKEYIFHKGAVSGQIYDLNTGHMIVELFITSSPWDASINNNNVILDNGYVVEFVEIQNYIEGHKLQEHYTLEEIKELEETIVDSVKKIIEYEKGQQKTKK